MKETIENKIISLEKKALERWNQGDPSGFLELSANDVVYFDPFTEHRIDGLEKLTQLYETIRGEIKVDRYEMINPKVHCSEEMAVLTYNLISHINNDTVRWNCTEVFRKDSNNEWKIIQTHWSLTKPKLNT
ncbi:MAG: nuclear transport factor 2 family protein [Bacteroidetes bacterium]|nr:nuclear transport factor 2 family protein [Bacteroidota bacterium]